MSDLTTETSSGLWATEALARRKVAMIMPRGELTPEQEAALAEHRQRWFRNMLSGQNASSPVDINVRSPVGSAMAGAGVGAGVGALVGGPVGAVVGVPVGALLGGGYQSAHNATVNEAMRRGATTQFDLEHLPSAY